MTTTRLNPVVYMVSGFRYGFLGISDVPLTLAVLVAFVVVLYLLRWTLIQRGRGLRT